MEIRRLDTQDDSQMHDAFSVRGPAMAHGRESMPTWQESEWIAAIRSPDEGERHESYLAVDDGRPVGVATVHLTLLDNLDMAFADVAVAPAQRRRGIGTALLDVVERRARADGRSSLLTDSKVPTDQVDSHPYSRFAAARGFQLSNVEVVRHQTLPVARDQLDSWEAEAALRAAGYELSTYVNEFPADLAPSLCTLLGQLAVDAPTGAAEFEEEVITPERLQQRHDLSIAMGREAFETVAVKDGLVAAQTTLSVSLERPEAFQWGTFVHRAHRGHSLGLAVKVANLRAVQKAHPHVTRATTQNAETNEWMIAINEKLGYRVVEASTEFLKGL